MKKNVVAMMLILSAAMLVGCGSGSNEKPASETKKEESKKEDTQKEDTQKELTSEEGKDKADNAVTDNTLTAPEKIDAMEMPAEFVGVWATGSNEDAAFLVISADGVWSLLDADNEDGGEIVGGVIRVDADAVSLYMGNDLYNTVFFGAEENKLYSSLGDEYELSSMDYNEVGEEIDASRYVDSWEGGGAEDYCVIKIYDSFFWEMYDAQDKLQFGGPFKCTMDGIILTAGDDFNPMELIYNEEDDSLTCIEYEVEYTRLRF